MVACGKEYQEGTFPAIWPVNPLWSYTAYIVYRVYIYMCAVLANPSVLKWLATHGTLRTQESTVAVDLAKR